MFQQKLWGGRYFHVRALITFENNNKKNHNTESQYCLSEIIVIWWWGKFSGREYCFPANLSPGGEKFLENTPQGEYLLWEDLTLHQ